MCQLILSLYQIHSSQMRKNRLEAQVEIHTSIDLVLIRIPSTLARAFI